MQTKRIGVHARLHTGNIQFLTEITGKPSPGAQFILESAIGLIKEVHASLKGRFSPEELKMLLVAMEGVNPDPVLACNTLITYMERAIRQEGMQGMIPVLETIQALHPSERLVLEIWCIQYWCNHESLEDSAVAEHIRMMNG